MQEQRAHTHIVMWSIIVHHHQSLKERKTESLTEPSAPPSPSMATPSPSIHTSLIHDASVSVSHSVHRLKTSLLSGSQRPAHQQANHSTPSPPAPIFPLVPFVCAQKTEQRDHHTTPRTPIDGRKQTNEPTVQIHPDRYGYGYVHGLAPYR